MAEQEMLLDTATIRAAVAGELWAKQKVIEHYTPMIDELAVDEDMKQHLILKLLEELPNFPNGAGIRKKSAGRRGFDTSAPGVLDNCRLCHSKLDVRAVQLR